MMKFYVGVQTVFLLFNAACTLYTSLDDVVQLTSNNFQSDVIRSDNLWLVEFYAPWCGHCKALAPEWIKVASALKGIVKVGAVNMDQEQSVGAPYGIRGFPTIKIFGVDKTSPTNYEGARSAEAIVNVALQEISSLVKHRLSGGGGGYTETGGQQGFKKDSASDVVKLTDGTFDDMVLKSEEPWLVEFFAPWCGHCKNLAPHWEQAASSLKEKVKLGAVDATAETILASKYNVRGYPTIKYFPGGKKTHFTPSDAEEYDGGRTADDIIRWAEAKALESMPAPDVTQMISNDDFEACTKRQICVISVLPHILDCQSDCRNEYLKILTEMAERFKKNMWGWTWAAAGEQSALEDSLGIGGFGYPAMAAVNVRKMKYSWLRGSFGKDGILEFLREVSVGRGSSAPVKDGKQPVIEDVEAWDGKDGEMPIDDDIDLSDVELEPLEGERPRKEEL